MLETIAVVLVLLWLLGMVSSYTMGGLIHVLLVVALIVVLLRVIRGRSLRVAITRLQKSDTRYFGLKLRERRKWHKRCQRRGERCRAKYQQQFPPRRHSIIRSVRTSIVLGILMPRALAVF